MDTFRFIDIYATKGIEYLIVIAFLVSVVLFHKFAFVKSKAVVSEGLLSLFMRKTHLAGFRWNPVMSYMKQPEDKAKK